MSTKLGKQIYNVIIVYPPELFEFYIYLNTMNWQYQLMYSRIIIVLVSVITFIQK